jgi:hypothetical protein
VYFLSDKRKNCQFKGELANANRVVNQRRNEKSAPCCGCGLCELSNPMLWRSYFPTLPCRLLRVPLFPHLGLDSRVEIEKPAVTDTTITPIAIRKNDFSVLAGILRRGYTISVFGAMFADGVLDVVACHGDVILISATGGFILRCHESRSP